MIYLQLFLEFFKVGLFTFGGGYAMIPLVKELVLSNGWLSEEVFYQLIGVCESTPGPIAINMATFVGQSQGGLLGSVVATIGVVLPSFIIILIIASTLKYFLKNKYVSHFLKGIQPVIVALILGTGIITLIKLFNFTNFFSPLNIFHLILLLSLFIIYRWLIKFQIKVSPIVLIAISAVMGIFFFG